MCSSHEDCDAGYRSPNLENALRCVAICGLQTQAVVNKTQLPSSMLCFITEVTNLIFETHFLHRRWSASDWKYNVLRRVRYASHRKSCCEVLLNYQSDVAYVKQYSFMQHLVAHWEQHGYADKTMLHFEVSAFIACESSIVVVVVVLALG